MLANARMLVTDGAAKTKQPTNALSKFDDAAQISSWARDAVAEAIGLDWLFDARDAEIPIYT